MSDHYEVVIVRTTPDGKRSATHYISPPRHDGYFGVGFLYRYLRTSRRKDAPPYFAIGGYLTEEQERTVKKWDRS